MAILSAQQSISWRIELRNQIGYSGRKSYADRLDPLSTSLVLRLVEVTHKNDRLDILSSLVNLTTEVGNRTENYLDSLSSVVKMSTVESNRTVAHDVICYSLRSVMEIYRRPHSKTNAFIDCIYHNQAPCCALLSPITPPLVYATAIHSRRISALYNVFGRFSPVLAYFALHLFRTG